MYCKNCGAPIDPQASVCVRCGVSNGAGETFCQNCGAQLAPGASVCVQCGAATVNTQSKSKMTAGLLGIFLGTFGVHNFYLGYTGKAVAQLLITVLSCGFAAPVSSVWGLIEGIMCLTGSIKVDGHGNMLGE